MTMLALPIMVNLERLLFRPLYAQPSAHILRQCTFQLRILEWATLDSNSDLMFFLSTQTSLSHLSIDRIENPTFGLAKNVLPQIISVAGDPSTLMVVSEAMSPRQILAFDCFGDVWPLKHASRLTKAMSGLKYLRTRSPSTPCNISKACKRLLDSIIVLEVTCRLTTVCKHLRMVDTVTELGIF